MFKKLLLVSLTFISSVSYAAQLVANEEAKKMNLIKIDTVFVGPRGGKILYPADVHDFFKTKRTRKVAGIMK
ncbi:hypothetical protein [Klebsiella pneumoniae]|uniref:hypothetical protein n=1 Tax=Klebsiella pneumoniae TaxID=573 RepID=UPI001084543D|nr:hypothetical protein [Klebsiella pneumoniae]